MKKEIGLISLAFLFLLSSCEKPVNRRVGDTWDVTIKEGIVYRLEFVSINNIEFVVNITDLSTITEEYEFVISDVRDVTYIIAGGEVISTTTSGITLSFYKIPDFENDIQIKFHFYSEKKHSYKEINAEGTDMYWNYTDIKKLGIKFSLFY